MWIKTYTGHLVNTDKFEVITTYGRRGEEVFQVRGWTSSSPAYILAKYSTMEQAESAVHVIFNHLLQGDNAMEMPVYNRLNQEMVPLENEVEE